MITSYEGAELPPDAKDWIRANPIAAFRELSDWVSANPDTVPPELATLGGSDAAEQVDIAGKVRRTWPSDAPPISWIVDGWLPAGRVSALGGRGAMGKTTLAVSLAASIAAGWERPFPALGTSDMGPKNCVGPAPIVWATWETAEGDFNRRLAGAVNLGDQKDFDALGDRLHFVDMGDFGPAYADESRYEHGLTTFGQALLDYAEHAGAVMLVMDPRRGAFSASELDAAPVNRFLRQNLRPWALRTGCGVLLVSHPPRGGEATQSGNDDWRNGIAAEFELRACPCARCEADRTSAKNEGRIPQDFRQLSVTKSNEGPTPDPLAFTWDSTMGTFALVPDHYQPTTPAPVATGNGTNSTNRSDRYGGF